MNPCSEESRPSRAERLFEDLQPWLTRDLVASLRAGTVGRDLPSATRAKLIRLCEEDLARDRKVITDLMKETR